MQPEFSEPVVGVIFGKFFPLHQGHLYMIDKAYSEVDKLVIFVCSDQERDLKLFLDSSLVIKPHATQRVEWLKQATAPYSNITVVHLQEDNLPSYPNGWLEWANLVKSTLNQLNLHPTKVYTSEPQDIENYSKYLGLEGVLVDPTRMFIRISGTECRKEIFKNFNFLASFLRNQFAVNLAIDHTYLRNQSQEYLDELLSHASHEFTIAKDFLALSNPASQNLEPLVTSTELLDYPWLHAPLTVRTLAELLATSTEPHFVENSTQSKVTNTNDQILDYLRTNHKLWLEATQRSLINTSPAQITLEHIMAEIFSNLAYKYGFNFAVGNSKFHKYNVLNGGKVNLSFDQEGFNLIKTSLVGRHVEHQQFDTIVDFPQYFISLKLKYNPHIQKTQIEAIPEFINALTPEGRIATDKVYLTVIDDKEYAVNPKAIVELKVEYASFQDLEFKLLKTIINFLNRLETPLSTWP